MDLWWATIRVMAHSTRRGDVVDKASVGTPRAVFRIRADNCDQALSKARLISAGIQTNPMVWQTKIESLTSVRPDCERIPGDDERRVDEFDGAVKDACSRIILDASSAPRQ